MAKLVRIVEKDKEYVSSCRVHLCLHFGGQQTADHTVLSMPDHFDPEAMHGLVEIKAETKNQDDAVAAWLKSYTGSFPFYLSLKDQFERQGYLSPKQTESILRAIEKDKTRAVTSANKVFTLKAGEVIRVSKFMAGEIAQKAGLVRPHFVMEVVSVEAETEKAYKATLKLSAQRCSHCSICGAVLTNPESVQAGIGPICAERVGVEFSGDSLTQLKEKLKVTTAINTWFPKKSIKERISVK